MADFRIAVKPNPNEKTLRDEFAMVALQGVLAKHSLASYSDNEKSMLASQAYKMADAMMEARKK